MNTNDTRALMKMLHLSPDEIYHIFCLALCLVALDGQLNEREGEVLTRVGFGLGLQPEDITALAENAKSAIEETSIDDVAAFSITKLKSRLDPEQMQGVRQILTYIAKFDHHIDVSESEFLKVLDDIWSRA